MGRVVRQARGFVQGGKNATRRKVWGGRSGQRWVRIIIAIVSKEAASSVIKMVRTLLDVLRGKQNQGVYSNGGPTLNEWH
jgi:hypothetical protein